MLVALLLSLFVTPLQGENAENANQRFSYDTEPGGAKCSEQPFYVSADVAEGNYNVTVKLGARNGTSSNTVKAEGRRLMIEKVETARGKFETRTFTVNVRYSQIGPGNEVRLKPREIGSPRWDRKLTLEFNGGHPCVASIEIAKAPSAVTVYLAGDSTVVDQDKEPWAAWGQMLPRFFQAGAAIANHAESGETLRSFVGEKRLEKVLSQIRSGDYLFIQFAHNDQKEGGNFADPFTSYKERLKMFIAETRKHGATPVLVTSMNRRTFDAAGKITNSLGDYPEAMRQTAREENVALIDLNAMSKTLYEAIGEAESRKAFVETPAGTDDTHLTPTAPMSWPAAWWRASGPIGSASPNT